MEILLISNLILKMLLLSGTLLLFLIAAWFDKTLEPSYIRVSKTHKIPNNSSFNIDKNPNIKNNVSNVHVRNEPGVDKRDNLQIIKGISANVEKALNKWGISSFKRVSEMSPSELKVALVKGSGGKYTKHNTDSWPVQASIALVGRMKDLERFQNKLNE